MLVFMCYLFVSLYIQVKFYILESTAKIISDVSYQNLKKKMIFLFLCSIFNTLNCLSNRIVMTSSHITKDHSIETVQYIKIYNHIIKMFVLNLCFTDKEIKGDLYRSISSYLALIS